MDELEIKDFEMAQQVRRQFPDKVFIETLVEISQQKLKDYDRHIERKRDEYNKLTSFTEKSDYYENILKAREEGYKLAKQRLETFIENPIPKPYEMWVTETTYNRMKEIGYKEYLTRYYYLIL